MKARALTLALLGVVALAGVARAADDDAERAARWRDLQPSIFGERALVDGSGFVTLDAPKRALDAALVPIGIKVAGDKPVSGLYLVIDDNPAPMAAHVTFGPAGDPRSLTLRVRVNQYTLMHAVAETADGGLYETTRFVKAAGGCSAPVGADEAASLAEMGRMKLRLSGDVTPGKPVEATLMIRHPNFNGMQMDQVKRTYTPMRFIKTIDVTYQDVPVLHLEGDISLSTDPVIGFGFLPKEGQLPGKLKVVVRDSDDAVFEESFDIPTQGS
jgi:sulfur-oxidizing protein SoxY